VFYLAFERRGQESLRGLAFFFGILFITEVALVLIFGVDYRLVKTVYGETTWRLGAVDFPMRLVVPFLQGYKSVKWVGAIRATRHDPVGIKRLLAQSKTGRLGLAWRRRLNIAPAKGKAGDP